MTDVNTFKRELLDFAFRKGGTLDWVIEPIAYAIVRGRAGYVAVGGGDPDGFVTDLTERFLLRLTERVTELVEEEVPHG